MKKVNLYLLLFLLIPLHSFSAEDPAAPAGLLARVGPTIATVCRRAGDIAEIEFILTPVGAPFAVRAGGVGERAVGARTPGEILRDEVEGPFRLIVGPLMAVVLPPVAPIIVALPWRVVEGIGRWFGMSILNPVVRTIVGRQSDETSMLGGCRVDMIIHNNTGIDLIWEKYDLRSGKIWSERVAPRVIETRNTGSFTASSRVPEPLGPEGFVQYRARDDSFRVRFYWNNPLETGAPTQARYTLLLRP